MKPCRKEEAVSQPSLEERVAALEREVAELRAWSANGSFPKDWRRTVGMFTDDPGMQRLFAEAMRLREADRARARRGTGRKRSTKA
jgi:hypothetical protein